MPQFDYLLAEAHRPAAPGSQIDRPDGNLRRQAKCIRGGRPVRDDDLAPLGRKRFDRLLDGGRSHAESAHNGAEVHAAAGTDELAAFG